MTRTNTPEHREEMIEQYMTEGTHQEPRMTRREAEAYYDWAFPNLTLRECQEYNARCERGIITGPFDNLDKDPGEWFVSGDDFVAQELEPRAVYLKDKETGATVFYQASLNQIFATRGQGKSIVTNALLRCLIGGEDFLRLTSDGDLNVLLVDGELPSVQLQERLKQFGDTGQLTILSPYLMSDPKEFPNLSQAADQQKFLDRIADLDAQVIHPEPSVRIVGIEPEAASQCVEDNGIEGQMSEPMWKRDDGIA